MWEALTAIAAVALTAITAALAYFTYWLWKATSDLVHGADETAKRQLRAYLTLEGFQRLSHTDTRTNMVWWSIHPIWKNGGLTPTKSLFLNTSQAFRREPLPAGFDFPDTPGETIRMLVGPGSAVTTSQLVITGEQLAAVRDGAGFFYIWGWARYRDIFADTPEHITRFCNQITGVLGNPTAPYNATTNIVEITISFHREHNCMDEDCQQQERQRASALYVKK